MSLRWCVGLVVLSIAGFAAAVPRDESLLSKIPGGANTLLYYDVEGAYQSPLGQREKWVNRFSETKAITLDSLPPTIKHLVIASRTNFASLEPQWKVGIAKTNMLIPLDKVAATEHGTIGQVAGQSAVLSPRNTYITSVGTHEIGSFHPADRQALTAWLKDIQAKKTGNAPAYLGDSVRSAGNAQIVAAVSLEDVIDLPTARHFLSHSPLVQQKKIDVDSLAKLFDGLKGFVLTLRITDRLEGQLKIDFRGGVAGHQEYLAALIYEILSEGGAAVEELKTWKPTATDTALILKGDLSTEAIHRLLCFFEMPAFYVHEAQKSAGSASGLSTPRASATLSYFNSLSSIINELRKQKLIDDDYNRYATWWDMYAKKIEQLSTVDVDQDVAAFGAQTANRLHAIAGSLRGVPIKVDEVGQTGYMIVGGSRWGITSMDTNVGQVREKQVKIVQGDKQARQDTWKKIDDGMTAMRKLISERYNVPVN